MWEIILYTIGIGLSFWLGRITAFREATKMLDVFRVGSK